MKFDAKRIAHLLYTMGIEDPFLVHDSNGARIDAALSVVFARQLEFVQKEFEETLYPDLIARDVIPIDYSVPDYAESYTYTRLEDVGEAAFVVDAAMDYPNVELSGSQMTARILTIGDSYQYTMQELRRASANGMQLDSEKAQLARRLIERKLDSVALLGVGAANLPGLANTPGITPATLTGAWATPATTGDSILSDVQKLWADIYTRSAGNLEPDTLLLPMGAYTAISTRYMSAYDRRFVKQAILESTGFKTIRQSAKLNNAGAANAPRAVAYKYDKSVVRLVIPQEIDATQPQAVGRSFKVLNDLRTGGTQVKNPLGVAYADGFI